MKYLFTTMLITFFSSLTFGQCLNDIILTKDLETLQVKITKVSDTSIEFNYVNETLQNSIGAERVIKITFSNGRVQTFSNNNNDISSTNSTSSGNDSHIDSSNLPLKTNTIAVLPANFLLRNEYNSAQSSKAQSYVEDYFRKNKGNFSINYITTQKTNSLLRTKGIDRGLINEYAPEELAKACGTEYVLLIEIDKQTSGTTTRIDNNDELDRFTNGDTQITEKEDFEIETQIWIYRVDGTLVFGKKVTNGGIHFENEEWQGQINRVLKKSPFYSK